MLEGGGHVSCNFRVSLAFLLNYFLLFHPPLLNISRPLFKDLNGFCTLLVMLSNLTDFSDILKMTNLIFSVFNLHRHGLHIFGEEPKIMVQSRTSQKSVFNFGLAVVAIRQLHMMLLMVNSTLLIQCFNVQRLLMNCCFSECFIIVEQGLMELRKLGIEHRLWEASRKEIDQDSSNLIARKAAA